MLLARSSRLIRVVLSALALGVGVAACDAMPGQKAAETRSSGGQSCDALKKKEPRLEERLRAVEADRQKVVGRLGEFESTIKQLNRFAPRLKATSLHVYPDDGPAPREISGHIRNGTDEEVRVMHLRSRFVPDESSQEPIERELTYKLRETLSAGEVQHAPYGQQILDAYPDVETEVWRDGELKLEVTALEGPDGKVLWDRRGEDRATLEQKRAELTGEIESLEQRLSTLRSKMDACSE